MRPFPAITPARMADVDRVMASRFGVEPIQLMEVAGHAVATFTRRLFERGDIHGQRVVVLAGSGGNGGDALVAARYMVAWGATVTVVLSRPAAHLTGLPAAHLRAVRALGVAVVDGSTLEVLPPAQVAIDGLLGFGAAGAPSGVTARLIRMINEHDAYVLAIDVPSGIDATTGAIPEPCVAASGTLTLGLPKTGLMTNTASGVTGHLTVADIGIPAAAYALVGVTVPDDLFSVDSFHVIRRGCR